MLNSWLDWDYLYSQPNFSYSFRLLSEETGKFLLLIIVFLWFILRIIFSFKWMISFQYKCSFSSMSFQLFFEHKYLFLLSFLFLQIDRVFFISFLFMRVYTFQVYSVWWFGWKMICKNSYIVSISKKCKREKEKKRRKVFNERMIYIVIVHRFFKLFSPKIKKKMN